MTDSISPAEFERSEGATDWRVLSDGAAARFGTGSLAESAAFVQAIAELDGIEGHPPTIDIRPAGLTVTLLTRSDDFWGMTSRDLDVARAISSLARERGVRIDPPSAVQNLLIVPGAPAGTDILPFWRAVLGYEPRPDSPDEDLVDPRRINPAFWFEAMAEPRGDGGGAIHIAVWVAPEVAEARVAAALAAGGRIVRDDRAPMWWTLADAAGNEADVSTIVGRG
jgi:4a-hydroxytetrahydrobiopterin dehydratase